MNTVILIIRVLFQVYTWVVFADVICSFFLPPYNPIKSALDRLVEPLLAPIRRILPSTGPFDFSPVVLLLLLQLVEYLILRIL